jgi:hypothetical protein
MLNNYAEVVGRGQREAEILDIIDVAIVKAHLSTETAAETLRKTRDLIKEDNAPEIPLFAGTRAKLTGLTTEGENE